MAPRPSPSTSVRTTETPFKVLILRADPDFEASRAKEPFYEFSNGRTFKENTAKQGPYSTVPNIR